MRKKYWGILLAREKIGLSVSRAESYVGSDDSSLNMRGWSETALTVLKKQDANRADSQAPMALSLILSSHYLMYDGPSLAWALRPSVYLKGAQRSTLIFRSHYIPCNSYSHVADVILTSLVSGKLPKRFSHSIRH